MRVALVGPSYSGKSTLFAAVAQSGGSQVHLDRADQEHLAVVKVPDERLLWLEQVYKAKKRTHAELEFLDVPGLDLSSDATRARARTHWPLVRTSDMIALVLRNFHNDSVPAYRDRVDVQADLDELKSEMLFSDLEQVMARIEKLQAALKKPTSDRDEQVREMELMVRLQNALEEEKPLTDAVKTPSEEKLVRAFAFLTLKPLIVVVNCDEGKMPENPPEKLAGYNAIYLSARIEEEIAALDVAERGEFMEAMGIKEPVSDRLIRLCYKTLNLVSYLTAGEKEVRAWTIPGGSDAVAAAGEIHTDIQRGFIRAEIVAYDDLKAAGSEKAAKAAGRYRLEGKTYIMKDGDVVIFRFNV